MYVIFHIYISGVEIHDMEKLCLQWNEFIENISTTFRRLREDTKNTDVALACEDGLSSRTSQQKQTPTPHDIYEGRQI